MREEIVSYFWEMKGRDTISFSRPFRNWWSFEILLVTEKKLGEEDKWNYKYFFMLFRLWKVENWTQQSQTAESDRVKWRVEPCPKQQKIKNKRTISIYFLLQHFRRNQSESISVWQLRKQKKIKETENSNITGTSLSKTWVWSKPIVAVSWVEWKTFGLLGIPKKGEKKEIVPCTR